MKLEFTRWFAFALRNVFRQRARSAGTLAAISLGVAGLILARLFSPKGRFGRLAYAGLSTAYVVLIAGILWLVLAKPEIDSNQFAAQLFEPGGLGRWLDQSLDDTRMPTP